MGDHEGRFVNRNPAAVKLLGYDSAHLMTMSIPDIHLPEDHERIREKFLDLRGLGRVEGEFQLKRRDGRLIWASLRALTVGKGLFIDDMIEQKRAQDQILQSDTCQVASQHSITSCESLGATHA